MFHLDNNSGVLVMPNLSVAQSNEPKWFTEGDAKVAASYPGQDWFNMVQAELLNILVEAGIKSNKTELNQLATAIKKIINAKIPAATTLAAGIVKLGSNVDKDDETIAATLKAVKKAYDLADGALPKGSGGIGLTTQISTNDIDIDTYAFKVGFYSGNNWSSTKGLPFGSTATDVWFYLINQNLASDGDDYKLQILGLNEIGTPRLAMRYKVKGAWTDWAEYITDKNVGNYQGIGYGQTWQNMTSSRQANVTYVNETSRPIFISISKPGGGKYTTGYLYVDDVRIGTNTQLEMAMQVTAIVPVGSSYYYTSQDISAWTELR